MQQVKIFVGREDSVPDLEKQINLWIRDTKSRVLNIQGNIAPQSPSSHPSARPTPSDVLVIITYEADPAKFVELPAVTETTESFDETAFPLHASF